MSFQFPQRQVPNPVPADAGVADSRKSNAKTTMGTLGKAQLVGRSIGVGMQRIEGVDTGLDSTEPAGCGPDFLAGCIFWQGENKTSA